MTTEVAHLEHGLTQSTIGKDSTNNTSSMFAKKSRNKATDGIHILDPSNKKLATVESQRVMSVLAETCTRFGILTMVPYLVENIDRFKIMLGSELAETLKHHQLLLDYYHSMIQEHPELLLIVQGKEEMCESLEDEMGFFLKHNSQMVHSCKNIMRLFALNPAALKSLRDEYHRRSGESQKMLKLLQDLRDITFENLLTTPLEENQRADYLTEIMDQTKKNDGVIKKLETELGAAVADRDAEITKRNDVIRRLKAELHQIEKFSEEHIHRTKSEADKQEQADMKNADGKKDKLKTELIALEQQLANHRAEHRESEMTLRKKRYKIETEVENWIQKYDQDMGERQDEYEDVDAIYTQEKSQLTELEERFKTLETEYLQIMEEKRIAEERRQHAERQMRVMVRAATVVQALWRSFKVRKALKKAKKKGKKSGKKSGKGKKKK